MRCSINVPNLGDCADAHVVASLAAAAEAAGWDGLFVWDHMVYHKDRRRPIGDPWVLLTAAALSTTRIKLGTLITPVARRRPHQLARQVVTLDRLSGGRVILGVGLGTPIDDEYGSFGEPTDPALLGDRLDEGLTLLDRYFSGESVNHVGPHYCAKDVALLPTPLQHPRVPIWVGGTWPNRRPMRRAAQWDGVAPMFSSARHGYVPDVQDIRDLLTYIGRHRGDQADQPFDLITGGTSPAGHAARDLLGPLADVGVTWWDERRPTNDENVARAESLLKRIEQGPPML